MEIGLQYIVVNSIIDDGYFDAGDRIIFNENGTITDIDADWIVDAKSAKEAMDGVAVVIDRKERKKR